MAKCGTHACRKEVFVIRMVLTFSTFNLHKGHESWVEKTKMHKRARKSLNLQQKLHSVVALCHVILHTRFSSVFVTSADLNVAYVITTILCMWGRLCTLSTRAWTLSSVWYFWEKETLPQSFTRPKKKGLWSVVYIWFFAEKVEKREKEWLWLKKSGGGGLTNISVNVKSTGFILKQPSIFIVICAAHFIMLVLELAWWERRAALD